MPECLRRLVVGSDRPKPSARDCKSSPAKALAGRPRDLTPIDFRLSIALALFRSMYALKASQHKHYHPEDEDEDKKGRPVSQAALVFGRHETAAHDGR